MGEETEEGLYLTILNICTKHGISSSMAIRALDAVKKNLLEVDGGKRG